MFEDATFWVLIALILFIALVIYLRAPRLVTQALDKRAEAVKTELDEARKLREEAQSVLADYQRKAREAEQEAEEIIDAARREASAYAAEAVQRTDEYVERRTKIAEQKIAQAETVALQEVRSLSTDLAIAAAERILTAKVKGAEAEKLISEAIDEAKARLH
jgi:F-type H+-transporting ATPase subunit b